VVKEMKSVVEEISPVKKKLNIEVEPDSVKREMDKAFKDVAKKAKIHGFRPGKAPMNIVEKHYGEEVRSEVRSRLISDSYLMAIRENKLSPVDMPQIENISALTKDSLLSYTATVEVRPNITLGVYDGLEVKETDLAVTEEELNQTLDRLREMYAQLEVVEGQTLAKDHTAIIDFEGFLDGKSIEGAKAVDHVLAIGSGNLIPGFEEQLIGMNKGETRDIQVTFPADYTNKEIAGKETRFTVTLKEVKKKVLPELNDEFAKDTGGNKTVDELKARIREDLEARKRDEQGASQREELMKKLVDAHAFEVPQGMVEHEVQAMTRQQAARLARQGMDVKSFDTKKFMEKNRDLAVQRVKGILLLEVIAEKEKVDVTEQELSASIAAMAKDASKTAEAVRKYYESQDGGLENLRASLIQEKTLGLLLSRAKKSYN
jgi:trigger factor